MRVDRQTIAELGQKVRANRATPEMSLVLQWISSLEADAIKSLIDCTTEEHAYQQARVHLLQAMKTQISEPSFAEQQAKYQVS
jgi:glutamate mutase epsilon subunit